MGYNFDRQGFATKRGTCYKLFLHMRRCTASKSIHTACVPIVEDYLECLHREKEVSRTYYK